MSDSKISCKPRIDDGAKFNEDYRKIIEREFEDIFLYTIDKNRKGSSGAFSVG
ncbi:hypothetical protein [Azospirillum rugosum]|uniref:Uncharacterized protein n=1 Tax=Azospirillum rugosum TaxID=416170 RepID=A0ABS4SE78_9PROT|nr:hypothetical protein [Azospirillum rugosum]MBP2290886.1 hypothetical protein [Azospirillum rugosum]